ncbi:MAG: MFS transporter [Hydrogenophaga sp.]|nr:MFS transporter [Hydrogenophaga sp.]
MTTAQYDWRSIAALNASSTLAQVGQFGIPFIVIPLWLEQQGASTFQLSLFASSLWLGQLPGLNWAPRLTQVLGAKRVILLALLVTVLALSLLATGVHALWLAAGLLAGFAQGLRWIGLEPWLYNIAPGHARGRLVGFHESLIALAPIVAPALCGWLGIEGATPLLLGMGFVLVSALPLIWATEEPRSIRHAAALPARNQPFWHLPKETLLLIGVVVALFGGMSESAFAGLFSIYGRAHQLDVTQIASLLISFGAGGLLLQYAAGWLADHRGVAFACLTCSVGAVGVSVLLTFPLGMVLLLMAVFLLGGLVTAYLTLALIASAKASGGTMARNMSVVSMVYTATAIVGPLLAGGAIKVLGGNGLMWTLAAFAVVLTAWLARIAFKVPGRSASL